MRRFLLSAVGVACAAALALPPALPAAGAARPAGGGGPGDSLGGPLTGGPPVGGPPVGGSLHAGSPGGGSLAGSTRTLALTPMRGVNRALGTRTVQALPARTVKPFSLLGITWDNPAKALHGVVQVRSRAVGTGVWSSWREVETHTDDVPDLADSADRARGSTRGATAPLWVGDSDGVQVRVRPERTTGADGATEPALPAGLRLDMVDPGDDEDDWGDADDWYAQDDWYDSDVDDSDDSDDDDGVSWDAGFAKYATALLTDPGVAAPGVPEAPDLPDAPDAPDAPEAPGAPEVPDWAVLPELTRQETRAQAPGATPFVGARPRIITRSGWGADEGLRKGGFVYTKKVKVAFVHHSGTGNNYTCAKAPSVIRSIYRYHVKSSGWRDIGYNFLVDKCGNIYEGRAGGVSKAVYGAHTLGFNTNSMGIALLGSYGRTNPSAAALRAIAKLTAWKLGLFGGDPDGSVTLTSGGSNKYKKGKKVKLRVISGHRDGFVTECPGARLYARLSAVRNDAAELQGR